jgi:hypothetical protein
VLIKGKGVRVSDVEDAAYSEMGWGKPTPPPEWPQHEVN